YINLALIQKRPHNKEGLYHFGFVVDDIEALKPLCKELGAASDVENRPLQAETRVHDPDGNGVDVSLRGSPVESQRATDGRYLMFLRLLAAVLATAAVAGDAQGADRVRIGVS